MTASAKKKQPAKISRPVKSVAKSKSVEELAVISDNANEEQKTVKEGADTVCIACALPLGLKFDDVPNGKGGTKTIVFPGLNQALRGEKGGVLLGAGHAVAVTLSRADWEAIKARHGREVAFVGVNGNPPCLVEMADVNEFNSRKTEVIADMKTGLEAADPKEVGVQKTDVK